VAAGPDDDPQPGSAGQRHQQVGQEPLGVAGLVDRVDHHDPPRRLAMVVQFQVLQQVFGVVCGAAEGWAMAAAAW
jgi:hypothetical protein